MKKKITTKEICEQLWGLEEELQLLELEIKGVRFWELIRFTVFRELTIKLSGYGQAHTKKANFQNKLLNLMEILKNSITRSPFKGNYKVDFLIFDHPRKVKVNRQNIDIYTHEFIKSQNDKSFDIIESPYQWKHKASNIDKNVKYTDHEIIISYLKKIYSWFKFDDEEKKLIGKIQEEVENRFFTKIDIFKITKKYLENFFPRFDYYKKLFRKRKPKSIYLVVYYSNIPIIAAAKELGIEVIEFQHGVISDYHYAYNYSNPQKKVKYFPDKIFTFGEYWANTIGFPKQTIIEVYGFPYLDKQLEKYKQNRKKTNQVLIISQGTIGKKLSEISKKLAEAMPDYNFIYKLHPGEYGRWKIEYSDLVQASNMSNLEVVDNNEKNLYSLLAESEYQIGMTSTAIFEGLTLNCKTILLNLPGIYSMKHLIEQNFVELANDVEEVKYYLKNYEEKNFPIDYFFKNSIVK